MEQKILKSPVAFAQQHLAPALGVLNGMEVALSYADAQQEVRNQDTLGLCDVSCFARFGVKGVNVAQWLSAMQVVLPQQANSWVATNGASLVLRLGFNEYLVEDLPGGSTCAQLKQAGQPKEYGVHAVPRNDASFILSGSKVQALFSEVCAIDLRESALQEGQLVMTQIAGISATLLRQTINGKPVYRMWCDGTYGPYMWETLLEIIEELGGGPVGLKSYYKDVM